MFSKQKSCSVRKRIRANYFLEHSLCRIIYIIIRTKYHMKTFCILINYYDETRNETNSTQRVVDCRPL